MKLFGPKKFKFHAWVKKWHFDNFSEICQLAGLAVLVQPFKMAHRIPISIFFYVMNDGQTNSIFTEVQSHATNLQNQALIWMMDHRASFGR